MKKTALLVLMVLALSGCGVQSSKWTGFYYPEGEPKQGKAVFETSEFENKELCEAWGSQKTQGKERATFFCGIQCHYDNSGQRACSDAPGTK